MHDFDTWYTLYEDEFDHKRFLYHYTSIEKAFKILYGEQLKFSKLSLTNDTTESKPKIRFNNQCDFDLFNDLIRHFYENNRFLQLICMSQDMSPSKFKTNSPRIFYGDYSGRGFALPRMWAQYADNNCGVCFIFDKQKLTSNIRSTLQEALILDGSVNYVSNFSFAKVNVDSVISYYKSLDKKSELSKRIITLGFLKKYKEFVTYNYFNKLVDWRGENEYRFLAYGDEDFYIPNIFESLAGIVVGESIELSNIRILEFLTRNTCDIMKIMFTSDGCLLKNSYES